MVKKTLIKKNLSSGFDEEKIYKTITGNSKKNLKVNKKPSNLVKTKDKNWQIASAFNSLISKVDKKPPNPMKTNEKNWQITDALNSLIREDRSENS